MKITRNLFAKTLIPVALVLAGGAGCGAPPTDAEASGQSESAVGIPLPPVVTSGFAMLGRNYNLCLDVAGGTVQAGALLTTNTCNTSRASQGWVIRQGWRIAPASNHNLCVDIQGGMAVNDARLILQPCDGAPTQTWIMQGGNITNDGGNETVLCVDVFGGQTTPNGIVEVANCNDTLAQDVWPFGIPLFVYNPEPPGDSFLTGGVTGTAPVSSPQSTVSATGFVLTLGGEISQTGSSGTNCVTLNGFTSQFFSPLSMKACTGVQAQTFKMKPFPRAFNEAYWSFLVSAEPWMEVLPVCLDLPLGASGAGTPVNATSCNPQSATPWAMAPYNGDFVP